MAASAAQVVLRELPSLPPQALALCCSALTCCCCCCCCFFCCGTCCPPKEDESYKYVDPKDLEEQMHAEDSGESGRQAVSVSSPSV